MRALKLLVIVLFALSYSCLSLARGNVKIETGYDREEQRRLSGGPVVKTVSVPDKYVLGDQPALPTAFRTKFSWKCFRTDDVLAGHYNNTECLNIRAHFRSKHFRRYPKLSMVKKDGWAEAWQAEMDRSIAYLAAEKGVSSSQEFDQRFKSRCFKRPSTRVEWKRMQEDKYCQYDWEEFVARYPDLTEKIAPGNYAALFDAYETRRQQVIATDEDLQANTRKDDKTISILGYKIRVGPSTNYGDTRIDR